MYVYMCVCVYIYIYMCGNTAYRAIEPLRITAREIPSPRQPYKGAHKNKSSVLNVSSVHLTDKSSNELMPSAQVEINDNHNPVELRVCVCGYKGDPSTRCHAVIIGRPG